LFVEEKKKKKKTPLGVAISFSFFFFFWVRCRQKWPDLSFLFFSPEKSLEKAVAAASDRRRWAVDGSVWVVVIYMDN
jgi:hypothetical protein